MTATTGVPQTTTPRMKKIDVAAIPPFAMMDPDYVKFLLAGGITEEVLQTVPVAERSQLYMVFLSERASSLVSQSVTSSPALKAAPTPATLGMPTPATIGEHYPCLPVKPCSATKDTVHNSSKKGHSTWTADLWTADLCDVKIHPSNTCNQGSSTAQTAARSISRASSGVHTHSII